MMNEAQPAKEDRSLGELLGDLTRELTTLVREEATLAKTEMTQKLSQVGKDVGYLAAGGAVAYAGMLAIVAAIIIGLAQAGMEWWVSALLVGVVVAAIGGYLVSKGLNALRQQDLTPSQTVETLKEDAQWIRKRAA
jgi:hypothetical protein